MVFACRGRMDAHSKHVAESCLPVEKSLSKNELFKNKKVELLQKKIKLIHDLSVAKNSSFHQLAVIIQMQEVPFIFTLRLG